MKLERIKSLLAQSSYVYLVCRATRPDGRIVYAISWEGDINEIPENVTDRDVYCIEAKENDQINLYI